MSDCRSRQIMDQTLVLSVFVLVAARYLEERMLRGKE